jgi:hypothetical protein
MFRRLFFIIFSVTALCSCAGPAVRPPSGSIGGIPAANAKVVLRHQQEVRTHVNMSYVLPAADYRAVMENDAGIFFAAPNPLFVKEIFLGMNVPAKLIKGGIYLERSAPETALIYGINPENQGGEIQRMLYGGRAGKPLRPRQPIVFELKRSNQ